MDSGIMTADSGIVTGDSGKTRELQLLWAEYSEVYQDTAYRYSQFCHQYRYWRDQHSGYYH